MTRDQFRAILGPLVLVLRADFDLPTWTAYYRALGDVPAPLLAAAVDRATKTATFMPKPGELRTFAEAARKALIASLPYDPSECAQCDGTGWETLTEGDVQRVTRCGCWKRHQAQVAELGCGHVPLALSPGTEMGS